jgi:transposase-like protein
VAARGKIRQFPTAYKLKAIKRVGGGEGVLPVARKLDISRKLLHDWIKAWKAWAAISQTSLRSMALSSDRQNRVSMSRSTSCSWSETFSMLFPGRNLGNELREQPLCLLSAGTLT